MRVNQQGFTLIELVVVIVILGILAATALPKFVDISSDAEKAATQGVAAALTSAGSINYGKRKASAGVSGQAISDATDACAGGANDVSSAATAFLSGSATIVTAAPATTNEYKITGGAPKICAADVTIQCTITHKNGSTATAYIPCTN